MCEAGDEPGWPVRGDGRVLPMNGPSEKKAGSCLIFLPMVSSSFPLIHWSFQQAFIYRVFGMVWALLRTWRAEHRGASK